MFIFEATFFRVIVFSVLGTVDYFLLIGGYSILRGLRISVNWVTWILGTLLMAASAVLCLSILFPNHFGAARKLGNLLGVIAFLVAVYSASQWTTRQWYVQLKRRTTSVLVQGSRNVLLFLRKHHIFFGWVATLTTLGHMAYYLPILAQSQQYEIISGFIALGILALIVLLGMWIWLQTTVRKQRTPRMVQTIHSVLAVAFLVVLLAHMSLVAL